MNIPVRYFLVLSSRWHLSTVTPTRATQIPCKRPVPPPPPWPRPCRCPTLTAPTAPASGSWPANSPMQPRNPRSSSTAQEHQRPAQPLPPTCGVGRRPASAWARVSFGGQHEPLPLTRGGGHRSSWCMSSSCSLWRHVSYILDGAREARSRPMGSRLPVHEVEQGRGRRWWVGPLVSERVLEVASAPPNTMVSRARSLVAARGLSMTIVKLETLEQTVYQ